MCVLYKMTTNLEKGNVVCIGPLKFNVKKKTKIEVTGKKIGDTDTISNFQIKSPLFRECDYTIHGDYGFRDVEIHTQTENKRIFICKNIKENLFLDLIFEKSFKTLKLDISMLSDVYPLVIDRKEGIVTL